MMDGLSAENIKLYYALIVAIIIVWIILILRVARDISRRTHNTFFQIFCILIITLGTPIVWWLLYLIIRPTHTLDQDDRYTSTYLQWPICLKCKSENLESSNYCVFCGDILKTWCEQCGYKYSREYLYCPKCGIAQHTEHHIPNWNHT